VIVVMEEAGARSMAVGASPQPVTDG